MELLVEYINRYIKPIHYIYANEYNLKDVSFYIYEPLIVELIIISDDKNTQYYYNNTFIRLKPTLERITSIYIDIIYGNMDWFSSDNPCGLEMYQEIQCNLYNELILR